MIDQHRLIVVLAALVITGSLPAGEASPLHESVGKRFVPTEVDGFTCYNTSLSGKGNQYPDPKSAFLKGADSYILLTLTKNPAKMVVEIKGLDGTTLDRKAYQ